MTGRSGPTTDAGHPLARWPIADAHPEPVDGKERDDAVQQLAGALRKAEEAHLAYAAELRLGDVEQADDWPTWYAEYLLGLR